MSHLPVVDDVSSLRGMRAQRACPVAPIEALPDLFGREAHARA